MLILVSLIWPNASECVFLSGVIMVGAVGGSGPALAPSDVNLNCTFGPVQDQNLQILPNFNTASDYLLPFK